jgi:hypothetical protein
VSQFPIIDEGPVILTFFCMKSVTVLETKIEVTYRAPTNENHYHSPSLPTHKQGNEKIVRKPSVEGEIKVASILE